MRKLRFSIYTISVLVVVICCIGLFITKKLLQREVITTFFISDLKTEEDIVKATFINDKHVQELYQILKDTTEIFEEAGIMYSIDGGTTLGAVRHQGLIPWDDDVDLIILEKDEVKLNKLAATFEKLGYTLSYYLDMYKISKVGNPVCNKDDKWNRFTYPYIDIFIMYHNKSTKVVEYFKALNKLFFPLEWFPESVFFPLKKYKFGPLMVHGPNDPVWYLNNTYGGSWNNEAVIFPKHFQSKYRKEIRVKVDGVFSEAALPKNSLLDRTAGLKHQIKALCEQIDR